VLSPTRLIANVAVSPNATAGLSSISVISGFQAAARQHAFETALADANRPAIARVSNQTATQATIYPGGYATVRGANLAVEGLTPRVTLNDTQAWVESYTPERIDFLVPADLPTGPATLNLSTAAGDALPLVVEIAPPPPVIASVVNAAGDPLDAANPPGAGDAIGIRVSGLNAAAAGDLSRVRVTLGGIEMKLVKIAEGEDGLYELQIELSGEFPDSTAALAVWVDGSSSAPKNIPVKQQPAETASALF
jgi:uncharacterized protein (TIGR03437 family)